MKTFKLLNGSELTQLCARLKAESKFIMLLDVWGAFYEVRRVQWLPGKRPGQMEISFDGGRFFDEGSRSLPPHPEPAKAGNRLGLRERLRVRKGKER